MYSFYLDKILLPVTPSKLTMKINNKNKTMTLASDGEINILKTQGLTDINFECLLPNVQYQFAKYKSKRFRNAEYYLKKLKSLKENNTAFKFLVVREMQNGDELFDTNMRVSLEDYEITEDAGNGYDIKVNIKLKQYRNYETKTVTIIEQVSTPVLAAATTVTPVTNVTVTPVAQPVPVESPPPLTYTVVEGDCLWNICKRYLGDGSLYPKVAELNGISNPNLIYPGQVLNLNVS